MEFSDKSLVDHSDKQTQASAPPDTEAKREAAALHAANTISGEPTPRKSMSRRGFFAATGALAAAGAVTATSATSVKAQEETPPHVPAMRTPERTAQTASVDAPDAVSLQVLAANRLGFGPRNGDWSEYNALGDTPESRFTAYVEQQLNPSAITDTLCNSMLAAENFVTLGKSRAALWRDHQRAPNLEWWQRILPITETQKAAYIRAVYSKRQLQEVLVDFWHNHFNVYGWDTPSASTWVAYDRDVIRANALGNFRKMLDGVSQSIAMLYYLDNISNTAGGPNENYARETFELHTLGSENYLGVIPTKGPNGEYKHPSPLGEDGVALKYVDVDVYNATMVFTGWRLDNETGAFRFDDSAHHKYDVIVLNKVIENGLGMAAGARLLDFLAYHPGTARHIARKLCRRLISDNPPESIVQTAADTFYANRERADQIKRTVRVIVMSQEFRSAWGEKIKRPFEFVVSALRATGANFVWSDSFDWRTDGLGQPLFGWRPPDGYPDHKEAWSSTMPMLQRWRMVNWLMDGWKDENDNLRINARAQTPGNRKTPAALVDYWANRILWRPLPPEEGAPILSFMAAGRNPDSDLPDEDINDRLRFMLGLILMSPSFQWR